MISFPLLSEMFYWTIFSLISLNHIVSITGMTLMLKMIAQYDVRQIVPFTVKNNIVSFQCLEIHFHDYHSSFHRTRFDIGDNV